MKRIMNWIIFVSICLVCMAFVFGCRLISSTNDGREVSMKDYYTREDFQSIVIGKSTYQDVYVIAPIETLQITSYGGFCDYPMQNGGFADVKQRLKKYGLFKPTYKGAVPDNPGPAPPVILLYSPARSTGQFHRRNDR